ncbi:GNAT family N-acetyltransferase [Halothiobacillus sp. DCM-1]|uniref:GNAT family N-acetyltransferase n=1 Tax=Halothiobacillus sp. DCM-1 TaxID=3112558 RepID=UPI00324CE50F
MAMEILIKRAEASDAHSITPLVGQLLSEIMQATGVQSFNFDLGRTATRLERFLEQGKYFVFVAWDGVKPIGFLSIYESYALYAEGNFGTIPELYVEPNYRSQGVGERLMDDAKRLGRARHWMRLEVTTPPLPEFLRTFSFYEREGFSVAGGRKMKVLL